MRSIRCRSAVVTLGFVFPAISCAEITSTSRLYLTPEQSSHTVALSADKATRRLVELFAQRGCQLMDKRGLGPASVLLKFKGARLVVTTAMGNRYGTDGVTHNIGSVYFVSLRQISPEQTELYILGKPTLDGREVCPDKRSGPDAPGSRCEPVFDSVLGLSFDHMTGREEAETIKSIWLTLDIQ